PGYGLVAEHHVGMEMPPDRARRVLVAVEAGEGAGRGAVIRLLGGGLLVPPHRRRRGGAIHAGRVAERVMRRIRDARREEPPDDGRELLRGVGLRLAEGAALLDVVDGRLGRVAPADTAEEPRAAGG